MAAPTRNLHGVPTGSSGTTSYAPSLTTWATGAAVEDLIVLVLAVDGNPTLSLPDATKGAGWELVLQVADATSAVKLALLLYRVHTAGTVPNPTITISASEAVSAHCIRVRPSAGKEIAWFPQATAQGSSTNPDPPSISNNSGAAQDVLFIPFWAGDAITTSTAAPTNYANHQTSSITTATNGTSIGSADRTINAFANAAAEDAGTFTRATEQWVSLATAFYERDITMRFNGATKHSANFFTSTSALAIANAQVNWGAGTWAYLNLPKTSGKYYYEFKLTAYSGAGINASIGIGPGSTTVANILPLGVTFHSNTGIYLDNVLQTTFGAGWALNDVLQLCVDYDAGKVWAGLNNAYSGSPSAGSGGVSYAASGKLVGATVYTKDDTITRTTAVQLTTATQTYSPPVGFTPAGNPVAPPANPLYIGPGNRASRYLGVQAPELPYIGPRTLF